MSWIHGFKGWKFYLLLAFTIIYTASLVPAFKITLQYVSVEVVTFFNYLIPAVFFLLIFLIKRNFSLLAEYKSKIHYFITIAFFGLVFNRLFYLEAFHHIQATEANILYYTYPLAVALLGFLVLREKIKSSDIAGLALGFFGAFIVITKLDFSFLSLNLLGDALAILGGISWALYLIFSKKFKFNAMVLAFYSTLFAAIMLGVYILLFSTFAISSVNGILGILYTGIAEAILLYLFIELLRVKSTFKIANAFYAIPFVVVILNYFILSEIIYPSYILGLMLLTLGIYIQNKRSK